MTTWQQQPIDSVQVPQVVGLSPEAAFNVVGQASLAPMFSAQPGAGQNPGVPSQWGQVPASFAGQAPAPGQAATHVIAQNPMPGAWVPRGSVVYIEWADMEPVAASGGSKTGWIVAAVLAALLIGAGLVWFLTTGGDANPEPSRTPTATATATATVTTAPSPRPTRTVTATATATKTATATATATKTPTAEPTPTDAP